MESRSSLLWKISEEWSKRSMRPHIGFESVSEMEKIVKLPKDLPAKKGLEKLHSILEWLNDENFSEEAFQELD